jgi:GNAT superfamily N-acetyltransferase
MPHHAHGAVAQGQPFDVAGMSDGDVVTLVVDKARRGEGIGTAIYASAAEMARGPAWAVMWRWNTWSQRAARHAGYVEWPTLSHGTVSVMRHSGRGA